MSKTREALGLALAAAEPSTVALRATDRSGSDTRPWNTARAAAPVSRAAGRRRGAWKPGAPRATGRLRVDAVADPAMNVEHHLGLLEGGAAAPPFDRRGERTPLAATQSVGEPDPPELALPDRDDGAAVGAAKELGGGFADRLDSHLALCGAGNPALLAEVGEERADVDAVERALELDVVRRLAGREGEPPLHRAAVEGRAAERELDPPAPDEKV